MTTTKEKNIFLRCFKRFRILSSVYFAKAYSVCSALDFSKAKTSLVMLAKLSGRKILSQRPYLFKKFQVRSILKLGKWEFSNFHLISSVRIVFNLLFRSQDGSLCCYSSWDYSARENFLPNCGSCLVFLGRGSTLIMWRIWTNPSRLFFLVVCCYFRCPGPFGFTRFYWNLSLFSLLCFSCPLKKGEHQLFREVIRAGLRRNYLS